VIPQPLIFDTATDIHDAMCERLMFGTERGVDYDWTHGTEVGLHNVVLGARSFDWEYDLASLWMPASRWTMMVRQYIDPALLDDWAAKVEERMTGNFGGRKARGIAVLRTNAVQGKGTGRGVRRRWGSCMLALSFRATPIPTVTLHSRTTYFGYLAAMDMTVAHAFARMAGEIIGVHPSAMQFVWTLQLAQFHGFRSLAWPLMDDAMRAQMDDDLPNRMSIKSPIGYRKALDGYHRIKKSDEAGKLYGDEAFSSFARVRRRFHTEAYGIEYARQFEGGTKNRGGKSGFTKLPQLWASSLDLATPLAGRPSKADETSGWDDDDED
jgi:hypothetical protein